MRSRFVQILSIGSIVIMLMYLVPDYVAWQNRYKSDAVLQEEEQLRQFKKDQAFLRANAKTEDERTMVSYWFDRDFMKEKAKFRVSDGIDRYEAWMLATTYFGSVFGSCGTVGLPQKDGSQWRVSVAIGHAARPGFIIVDARSGRIHSDGQPEITNPIAFLDNPEMPNKAPEPTPTSVTSPAAQEPRQP